MKRTLCSLASIFAIALLVLGWSAPASASGFTLFGDATTVTPGPAGSGQTAVVNLLSDNTGVGYSGIAFVPVGPMTLGDLTDLEVQYQMITNTFGGGSPRFYLCQDAACNNAAFGNLGTSGTLTDPTAGTWAGTGNYADLSDPDLRWNTNGNGFGSANINFPFATFAALQAAAGVGTTISEIGIVVDAGWAFPNGGQSMDVNNFRVNGDVYTATAPVPEPASLFLFGTGALALTRYRRRRATA